MDTVKMSRRSQQRQWLAAPSQSRTIVKALLLVLAMQTVPTCVNAGISGLLSAIVAVLGVQSARSDGSTQLSNPGRMAMQSSHLTELTPNFSEVCDFKSTAPWNLLETDKELAALLVARWAKPKKKDVSDARIMKFLSAIPYSESLIKVIQLSPHTFYYRDLLGYPEEGQRGLIADEVELVLPEYVATQDTKLNGTHFDNLKSINYALMVTDLIGAIRELARGLDGVEIRTNYVSDARIKELVLDIPSAESLAKVIQLSPHTFCYRDQLGYPEEVQRGLIADEVELVLPEYVTTQDTNLGETHFDSLKSINYALMVTDLIGAIKALKERLVVLEKELARIETSESCATPNAMDRLNVGPSLLLITTALLELFLI